MRWDIFCRVIDNLGDIGVCWRLAAQLGARGHTVRLRVDDASALPWLAPFGAQGVEVLPWAAEPGPGEIVIEAFGCELPAAFQALLAAQARETGRQAAWINLEYLTAEPFAERSHGLPSPVLAGAAAGLVKHFFYPGFTPRTGGLLRDPDLLERQAAFDAPAWLEDVGVRRREGERLTSLFCYEPAALGPFLHALLQGDPATRLLVTPGRAAAAVRDALAADPRLRTLAIEWLPFLPQPDFDHLLWACDFNFVRGEDSLVRALWAGKPFAWQIYPQHDDAHHAKLEAFLDWLQAPASWRGFHRAWNGITGSLPPLEVEGWAACARDARARLLAQEDLATQLERFVAGRQ